MNDRKPVSLLRQPGALRSQTSLEIQTRQAQVNNFSANLNLQNGLLAIKPLALEVGGGKISGNIKVDASQPKAAVVVKLDGKQVQLGQLNPLKETLSGGATDLTVSFSGTGNSTQALAANANGKLLVKVGNAELKQEEKKGGFFSRFRRS